MFGANTDSRGFVGKDRIMF